MTERQAKWLNKARRSLAAARRLLNEGDSDIAASRAYYAMFYAATALLDSRGLSFKRHSALIAAFGKEFTATGVLPKELHKHLASAENARHIGDYLIDDDPAAADVAIHLDRAEKFIQIAEQFLSHQVTLP